MSKNGWSLDDARFSDDVRIAAASLLPEIDRAIRAYIKAANEYPGAHSKQSKAWQNLCDVINKHFETAPRSYHELFWHWCAVNKPELK